MVGQAPPYEEWRCVGPFNSASCENIDFVARTKEAEKGGRGSILPETVKVISTVPMGVAVKLIGEGLTSGKVHQPILTVEQIAELDEDARRLGR